LLMNTLNSEYPVALNDVCSTTSIPCTGLNTEKVRDDMAKLAVDFFSAKLVRAAGGDVGGNVPPTLPVTRGPPASFRAVTAGVGKDYFATTTATVISSAGDATLSVADPSTNNPGHLVNGTFALPQALQTRANTGTYAPLGALLTYTGPISNDVVTIGFKQTIGANDALRSGAYSKTLTFTLSTTSP